MEVFLAILDIISTVLFPGSNFANPGKGDFDVFRVVGLGIGLFLMFVLWLVSNIVTSGQKFRGSYHPKSQNPITAFIWLSLYVLCLIVGMIIGLVIYYQYSLKNFHGIKDSMKVIINALTGA